MRILFAAAELSPLARVGGLGEATAGLVSALRAAGETVEVVLPDYGNVVLSDETVRDLAVPDWAGPAHVRTGRHPVAGSVSLITAAGTARPHPYVDESGVPWHDNEARFLSFSAAVAAFAQIRDPDLLHLNDWHTGAVLAFMASPPPAVLTIHTLGYQGITDGRWLERLPHHRLAYEWFGQANPLLGAIRLSHAVVAVSPNYASEVVTPTHGAGLDRELAARGDSLVGILNGIDTSVWNPSTDAVIASTYDATSVAAGKEACRRALCERVGLTVGAEQPLIGIVSRLVDQKGIDIAVDCLDTIDLLGAGAVVLGSGERDLAERLRSLADRFVGRVAFVDAYDAELAHQIFAGSDLYLMPSRFEPCGLAQMQAMTYGTLPVVTDVGGLHDTVTDADRSSGDGTGIVAARAAGAAVADALWRGVRLWSDRTRRSRAQRLGMSRDWSWTEPAARHVELYRSLR